MQDPLLTLPPPGCQMRRVQPFSTQQRPDLAGRPRCVGLAQDPQLVPHRELPPTCSLQPLRHLRVRPTRSVRHDRHALAFDGAILRRHGLSSFSTLTSSSFSRVSPTIDRVGVDTMVREASTTGAADAAMLIMFGEPTVKSGFLPMLDAEVTNQDSSMHSFTVEATFLKGGQL